MLLLLLLALLALAGCLLWFMSEAVDNERLAVRQRLNDLYQAEGDEQRTLVDAFWQRRLDALEAEHQWYQDHAHNLKPAADPS